MVPYFDFLSKHLGCRGKEKITYLHYVPYLVIYRGFLRTSAMMILEC